MSISISKNFYDISIVPKNWKEKRLKNILSISENTSSNFKNEKILSLTKKGIVINDISSNKGQIAESYAKYIKVKKGQICMNPMDLLSGWVDISNFEGLISPAYYTFELSEQVENKFVNYFFQSNYLRKTFFKLGKGVASHDNFGRWVLTPEELKNICLFIPNIEEQKLISRYLDKKIENVDSLVKKIQKKIELLKENRKALINQYITKGLDPSVEMKSSGVEWIGKIPNHWTIKKIKHLSKVKRGSSPRPIDDPRYFDEYGRYSWVRISDVSASGKYLEKTTEKLSELGSSLSTKMDPGDLFLSIAGTVGKPIITKIECCIHDGFVWFDGLDINHDYLYYLFLVGSCFQGLGKMGTQLNLNTDTVGDVQITFPPKKEQEKIVLHIENDLVKIDRLIRLEQQRKNKLNEYRQTLISSVVTGKVRLTEDMI